MELESVRALKAELATEVIRPRILAESAVLGPRARSLDRFHGVERTVALGVAKGKGRRDYTLAVRVQNKGLEDADLIKELETRSAGEVDYRYIGRVVPLQAPPWYQQRQRPLLIGASVAHHRVTAGTIGAFVVHQPTERPVILSNNHVLANEGNAAIGDPVLQPGPFDNGQAPDRIGELLAFVPMAARNNLVDAAIASIDEGLDFDRRDMRGLGTLEGVRAGPLEPGDEVAKVGRTTGVTHGRVTAVELDDVVVGYDGGALSFDGQIEIEGAGSDAFSAGGDSGSLIVDGQSHACALLFAGGDEGGSNGKGLTYANPIHEVVAALGLAF